jgi:hypothetical protein
MLVLFPAIDNNGGKEAPFPAGLDSRNNRVDVIVRAYDRSGAFKDVWSFVTVRIFVIHIQCI